ncbi:hypothetical protein BS17DRAFT_813423 [Gyrodon lividus]|nr:hypothetical protein BS17DRAFT_813423 [Gyrodon lividus]
MLILGIILHIALGVLVMIDNLGKSEPGSRFLQSLSGLSPKPLAQPPVPENTSDDRHVHLSHALGNLDPTVGHAYHQPNDLADSVDATTLVTFAVSHPLSQSESDNPPSSSGKHSPQLTNHPLSPNTHLPGSVTHLHRAENPVSKIRSQPERDNGLELLRPDRVSGQHEHSRENESRKLARPYGKITRTVSRWFHLLIEVFSVVVICAVRTRLAAHFALSPFSYVAFILIGRL